MPDPTTYQFELPLVSRPANVTLNDKWYPGIQQAAIEASSRRLYDAIEGVRAVVIHATTGASTTDAAGVIFDRSASFHWIVPDEHERQHGEFVWATCHEARAAWHVRNAVSHPMIWGGRNKINHFSLGVEVVKSRTGSLRFSEWQVAATANIVRFCWAKYPNLKHVVSHARLDPTRCSDPGSLFPWQQLKKLVLSGADETVPYLASSAALDDDAEPATNSFCMTP